jgi:uncharacterized protein YxjI
MVRYVVKQHVYTTETGSAHPIKDEYGRDAYLIDGRAGAPGDRLSFRDRRGRELAFIRQTLLATVPTFEIYYADELQAVVRCAPPAAVARCRFAVDATSPEDLQAEGNFPAHEYQFTRDGRPVATVSRSWSRPAGTYGVDVAPSEDDVLILAGTVVLDLCSRPTPAVPDSKPALLRKEVGMRRQVARSR